ncbi:MAG TPA: hypothetical protein VMZ28_24690 [Kofleriaceae bacterium]|nr:hypothetical protein [Kofleriaceae bacterium]
MKKTTNQRKKSLELRRETLRQLDPADLQAVGGGAMVLPTYLKYCMGTNWYRYQGLPVP